MSKIREILCHNFNVNLEDYYDMEIGIATAVEYVYHRTSDPIRLEDCMREYAEWYAKECLKIVAENAKTVRCPDYDKVNKDSILNIKLPEHD